MVIRTITPVPEQIRNRVQYQFSVVVEGAPHWTEEDTTAEWELMAQELRRLLAKTWPDRWTSASPRRT